LNLKKGAQRSKIPAAKKKAAADSFDRRLGSTFSRRHPN